MSRYPPPTVELAPESEPRPSAKQPAPAGETQTGRCPWCWRTLHAIQMRTGPGWLCGCGKRLATYG